MLLVCHPPVSIGCSALTNLEGRGTLNAQNFAPYPALLLLTPPPHASDSTPCLLELDDITLGNFVPLPPQTAQHQDGGGALSLAVPILALCLNLNPVQRCLSRNLRVLVGDLEVWNEVVEGEAEYFGGIGRNERHRCRSRSRSCRA